MNSKTKSNRQLSLAVELTPEQLALTHGGGLPTFWGGPGTSDVKYPPLTDAQRRAIENAAKAVVHAVYEAGKKVVHFIGGLF